MSSGRAPVSSAWRLTEEPVANVYGNVLLPWLSGLAGASAVADHCPESGGGPRRYRGRAQVVALRRRRLGCLRGVISPRRGGCRRP